MEQLEIIAKLQVSKSVDEVFDAIIDPAKCRTILLKKAPAVWMPVRS
jgi:hypothetical protein